MTFDIGPALASFLAALVPAVVGVITLWIKTSRDANRASSERADATRAIHEKIDDTVAPVVGGAVPPPKTPAP